MSACRATGCCADSKACSRLLLFRVEEKISRLLSSCIRSVELSRTRKPGVSRATRASLALQRLLPEASAVSAAKGGSFELSWQL